jgi:hypothetical protein
MALKRRLLLPVLSAARDLKQARYMEPRMPAFAWLHRAPRGGRPTVAAELARLARREAVLVDALRQRPRLWPAPRAAW